MCPWSVDSPDKAFVGGFWVFSISAILSVKKLCSTDLSAFCWWWKWKKRSKASAFGLVSDDITVCHHSPVEMAWKCSPCLHGLPSLKARAFCALLFACYYDTAKLLCFSFINTLAMLPHASSLFGFNWPNCTFQCNCCPSTDQCKELLFSQMISHGFGKLTR